MELGTTLFAAMQKADSEKIACFVQENCPGSRRYEVVGIPSGDGTYFRIEPNRIVTRVVGRPLTGPGEDDGDEEEAVAVMRRRGRFGSLSTSAFYRSLYD